jgi:hypothetical protein
MYITEYATAIGAGKLQVPQEPALAVQTVDFTTSTASAALQEGTKYVSIQLDADGHIHFAAAPVATVETSRVHKAFAVSWHGVNKDTKIAALAI